MPRFRRRRRIRRYGPLVLGLAILVWTCFQWHQLGQAKWTLYSFDRKNMVWTSKTGEVLFVTASGENLSGYRVIPSDESVTFHDVSVSYERLGAKPLQSNAGTGNLFEDLK